MAYLKAKIWIHLVRDAQKTLLLAEKLSFFKKYANFLNVFSKKFLSMFLKRLDTSKFKIDLESNKLLFYRSIYSLGLVELKSLKTYIKINLDNRFIQPFKSPVKALIFLVRKPNKSLCLYVYYHGLNNLIIKN